MYIPLQSKEHNEAAPITADISSKVSMSPFFPFPSLIFVRILISCRMPSRQGTHLPQDSLVRKLRKNLATSTIFAPFRPDTGIPFRALGDDPGHIRPCLHIVQVARFVPDTAYRCMDIFGPGLRVFSFKGPHQCAGLARHEDADIKTHVNIEAGCLSLKPGRESAATAAQVGFLDLFRDLLGCHFKKRF
jgi:hypothetical protein